MRSAPAAGKGRVRIERRADRRPESRRSEWGSISRPLARARGTSHKRLYVRQSPAGLVHPPRTGRRAPRHVWPPSLLSGREGGHPRFPSRLHHGVQGGGQAAGRPHAEDVVAISAVDVGLAFRHLDELRPQAGAGYLVEAFPGPGHDGRFQPSFTGTQALTFKSKTAYPRQILRWCSARRLRKTLCRGGILGDSIGSRVHLPLSV
jgi:hypothetical protein